MATLLEQQITGRSGCRPDSSLHRPLMESRHQSSQQREPDSNGSEALQASVYHLEKSRLQVRLINYLRIFIFLDDCRAVYMNIWHLSNTALDFCDLTCSPEQKIGRLGISGRDRLRLRHQQQSLCSIA